MMHSNSRAALVAGILASTASASFSASGSTNVALYWGQGSSQNDLAQVCADKTVDIVNVAIVNQFPKNIGDYPATNFGMFMFVAHFQTTNLLCSQRVWFRGVQLSERNSFRIAFELPNHRRWHQGVSSQRQESAPLGWWWLPYGLLPGVHRHRRVFR